MPTSASASFEPLFASDHNPQAGNDKPAPQAKPLPAAARIAILGAGMSGLCMAIQLRKLGVSDFVIIEKAQSVGGTWRDNTYPNIACDVPSHVYSFSFELNPNWSHSYSGGKEIWNYCERCVDKYGLDPYLYLGNEVEGASYDTETETAIDGKRWTVTLTDGRTLRADMVISGLGGLHLPKRAEIEGIDSFTGKRFHTALWDHDHDLKDRKVALIGTGASAGQTLPGIVDDVSRVTVFQRSPAWVFPRLDGAIEEPRRARFRKFPWMMRAYRWFLWVMMDLTGILSLRRGSRMAAKLKENGLAHLKESVIDPSTRAALTPDYAPGCKRRVISDDYLSSFNHDNCKLITTGIDKIVPTGVVDSAGNLHEVDTLIEATGFKPFDITDYVQITGRNGQSLQDAWKEKVDSHRTMMVPGFPNFFIMLGPNSATGHTSALIMIESAASYIVNCLRLLNSSELDELDPDPSVVANYNARLQKDLNKLVFSENCGAWYTDDNDHNYTLWPYSAARFLWEQASVNPGEFRAPAPAAALGN